MVKRTVKGLPSTAIDYFAIYVLYGNFLFSIFSGNSQNSIHKLILDVFSSQDCILHFYTNDLMVLIDIIAR